MAGIAPKRRRNRRDVTTSVLVRPKEKLWAYGYADLAALFRVSRQTVRQWVCGDRAPALGADGKPKRVARPRRFDPSNLEALIRFAIKLRPDLLTPLSTAKEPNDGPGIDAGGQPEGTPDVGGELG